MNQTFLSIIVPIYNVEAYLDECLNSLYAISRSDIELILVNDGSTDGSLEIMRKFESLNKHRTIIIDEGHYGVSVTRNKGLDAASGKWISFVDSDDYVESVAYERLISELETTTCDLIAFDGYRYHQKDGSISPLYSQQVPFENVGPISTQTYLEETIKLNLSHVVSLVDKFYRKTIIDKLKLRFVEGYVHEDLAFTVTLFVNDLLIEYRPNKVMYYRQRPGSIMSTDSPHKLLSKIFIINYLLDLFEEKKFNSKTMNGYLVFMSTYLINKGGRFPYRVLIRLFEQKLVLRKRLVLCSLFIKNVFN